MRDIAEGGGEREHLLRRRIAKAEGAVDVAAIIGIGGQPMGPDQVLDDALGMDCARHLAAEKPPTLRGVPHMEEPPPDLVAGGDRFSIRNRPVQHSRG